MLFRSGSTLEECRDRAVKFLEQLEAKQEQHKPKKKGGHRIPTGIKKYTSGYRVYKIIKGVAYTKIFADSYDIPLEQKLELATQYLTELKTEIKNNGEVTDEFENKWKRPEYVKPRAGANANLPRYIYREKRGGYRFTRFHNGSQLKKTFTRKTLDDGAKLQLAIDYAALIDQRIENGEL